MAYTPDNDEVLLDNAMDTLDNSVRKGVNMPKPEAYGQSNQASIDGMDTIFDTTDVQAISTGIQTDFKPTVSVSDTTPANTSAIQEDSTDEETDSQEHFSVVTVTEAARILGVPYTTFYRHVKSGKYKSVQGSDGKLRVLIPESDKQISESSPVDTGDAEVISEEHSSESRHIQADTILEIFRQQAADLETARKELKESSNQLQAANYRIGYLESQVDNHNDKIKLLTDSQRTSSLWSRFCSWFTGGSGEKFR